MRAACRNGDLRDSLSTWQNRTGGLTAASIPSLRTAPAGGLGLPLWEQGSLIRRLDAVGTACAARAAPAPFPGRRMQEDVHPPGPPGFPGSPFVQNTFLAEQCQEGREFIAVRLHPFGDVGAAAGMLPLLERFLPSQAAQAARGKATGPGGDLVGTPARGFRQNAQPGLEHSWRLVATDQPQFFAQARLLHFSLLSRLPRARTRCTSVPWSDFRCPAMARWRSASEARVFIWDFEAFQGFRSALGLTCPSAS